ncbi:hypothetical protein [Spirosoma linguale]|uniref:DUF4384 domain-containing protein n=1 Tax=Spirosoma linguale (strain ATCC 33905 / DSM 74 / LMG 10896 / Claus 1) TaxID=504472 RepID=D2QUE3_SPILD|nr:hypothetical protein Slin_6468 [Spirosoma linguale DSM 74]
MKSICPIPLILIGLLMFFSRSQLYAQATFTKGDTLAITNGCNTALDNYMASLNAVNREYCQQQGEFEAKLQTLIGQSFLSRDSYVYNDIDAGDYKVSEYAQRFGSYHSEAELDMEHARYLLKRNAQKQLAIVIYVRQTTGFTRPGEKASSVTTALAIHWTFNLTPQTNGYQPQQYKIVKIEKEASVPAQALPYPDVQDLSALREAERSLNWTAYRLGQAIHEKLPPSVKKVIVQKFSYQKSLLTNEFSDKLADALSHHLRKDEDLTVLGQEAKEGITIKGYYQQSGELVEIIAELIDIATGKPIARLKPNRDLSVAWTEKNGLPLKPGENDEALAIQQMIGADAPARPTKPQQLSVNISTTQSIRPSQEFWESDTMSLKIRVNKPCHLRLLYLQADGKTALLWSDYEVKADAVNQEIFFPTQFQCVPPFGQETLIVTAANDSFCPIATEKNDYGVSIITGTLADAMKSFRCTRGMAPLPEKAEARLVITTRGIAK